MSDHRASLIRLYDTIFDRAPDAGGLEYWTGVMGQGHTLPAIAGGFMQAPEFAATYGQPTNRAFVESLYENILDRPGEEGGVAFWTGALDEGRGLREHVVVAFSDSPEHIAQMAAPPPPAAVQAPANPTWPANIPTQPGPSHMTGTIYGDNITGYADRQNIIRGDDGNDKLFGGALADTLNGEAGDDTLDGRGGGDVYIGGPGRDWMVAGDGADTFRFAAVGDADGDGVYGFRTGTDKLDFSGLGLSYRGTGDFVPGGGPQLRHEQWVITEGIYKGRSGDTNIHFDADGDGNGDLRMIVTTSVAAGDFLL